MHISQASAQVKTLFRSLDALMGAVSPMLSSQSPLNSLLPNPSGIPAAKLPVTRELIGPRITAPVHSGQANGFQRLLESGERITVDLVVLCSWMQRQGGREEPNSTPVCHSSF
jgi:hypothetical protein